MRAAIYFQGGERPVFADFVWSRQEWQLAGGALAVHRYAIESPMDALKRAFPGASILVLRGAK